MQMTPEPLPSRDVPYDPDMTVQEALDAGLVAIIDSGRMSNESRLCGEHHPTNDNACCKAYGHKGRHAMLLRWNNKEDAIHWTSTEFPSADKMADAVERFDKHMKELAQKAQHVQKVVDRAGEEAMKVEAKHLQRLDSIMYGGLHASRKMQFRDKHTGKIRGPK